MHGIRLNSQLIENGRGLNSIYLFDVTRAAYIGRFNIHRNFQGWKQNSGLLLGNNLKRFQQLLTIYAYFVYTDMWETSETKS